MERNISKEKRKNSNIATWILLIFSAVFFISYPFHYSFLGGLISSLCCAAMIGGLADWFAVVALFRTPLNSNVLRKLFESSKFIRTEIIPKNRERIFQALVDMVEKELLTKESIISKLENINPSGIIIDQIKTDKKQNLHIILDTVFKEIVCNLNEKDLENIETLTNKILKDNLKSLELSNIISQVLDWMWDNGYKEKITDILIDKIEELSKTYEAKMLIQDAVLHILELNRGSFLIMIVGFFVKGNLENISKGVQEKLVGFLADMREPDSIERGQIQSFAKKQLDRLKTDDALKNSIENWKNEKLVGNDAVIKKLGEILTQYISSLKSEPTKTFHITEGLLDKVENQLEDFVINEEKQITFNTAIKNIIEQTVEKNHYKIGLIVKEKLDGISGEELSNMIEPIIGSDLQLIRINGSLVGGLVGIITYLLTFWIV
ncbi:DUF445 domain-containing protein [Clostridium cellulovorans]|uniref:DUF445 domain-containing protein n=1 Tax=Clostridium cellulovorans (strain ATCC 35296 / DSM 3052 / OCM 3 / 743B) TaxID=573061 RepID=D9SR71_CLOC7|nr:DUF445 domain-containing protein [Clostridium cellulovorans]ADL50359.1 protein of unknown function DUF445 [Clostridium cellulovorans 743B]